MWRRYNKVMRRLRLHELHSPVRIGPDGVARIDDSRVTLDTVVDAYRSGCTAEEIVEQYPSIRLASVHAAIAYYLCHRDEVEAYVAERLNDAATIRAEASAVCDQAFARARLVARQSGTHPPS